MRKSNQKSCCNSEMSTYEAYFKIGISDDYILIRDDFPIQSISPGDFSKLCLEMFRRNDEVRRNEK
jgi:hypothetical protein